jgi:hypothetical protein
MWHGGRVIPTFWWDGHPNFGDDMTPWLLPRYGILPVHRRASEARLAGVGSILEFLPQTYDGAIWGSGLMADGRHPLPDAHVLAVRGPLTAERIGATGSVAYGDPGLLVSRHVAKPPSQFHIGIVPHGHHRENSRLAALARTGGRVVTVINVHRSAAVTVRQIASCDVVFTTSLHGLVTADSYGIPACWTTMEPPLTGGDFKFRDYEAAVTPGRSRYVPFSEVASLNDLMSSASSADDALVRQLTDGLERALALWLSSTGGRSFPWGVVSGASLGIRHPRP